MLQKEESPVAVSAAQPGRECRSRTEFSTARQPTKKERGLAAFITGQSFNRWEAAHAFRDWCLHSSVAELERDGVKIARKGETVTGAFGKAHCVRYWLDRDPANLERACALLAALRAKRGAA